VEAIRNFSLRTQRNGDRNAEPQIVAIAARNKKNLIELLQYKSATQQKFNSSNEAGYKKYFTTYCL